MNFICAKTGGVPPWFHHTSKRDWLGALEGIGRQCLMASVSLPFRNRGRGRYRLRVFAVKQVAYGFPALLIEFPVADALGGTRVSRSFFLAA